MSRRHRRLRYGLPAVFAVIGLILASLVAILSSRQPGPQIHQEFHGPVNAPIIIHLSADQQAEVEAKVGR